MQASALLAVAPVVASLRVQSLRQLARFCPPCRYQERDGLRDATNLVARSFNTHDTLRSISCAMRVNSTAVSSVVLIMIWASFVTLPVTGLPGLPFFAMFISVIIVNGLAPVVNRQLLLATLCRLSVTVAKHYCYNFPFRLSEKLP